MTITQAAEGFNAVCKLAKSRSVEEHSLSRRLADEAEVVRLYRAAVYGGDGRQQDLGGDGKPPIDSPEIQKWIRQVLGYFAGCYKGDGAEPECWHAGKLRITKDADPMLNTDLHAGVRMIRQYYPTFQPARVHFDEAKWGD